MNASALKRFAKHTLPVLIVLIIAAGLRLYNINWDSGTQNHPDERWVHIVSSQLAVPDSVSAYFDSGASSLNPFNKKMGWVYGTLPLFVIRSLAETLNEGCGPQPAVLARMLGSLIAGDAAANCNEGFFTSYDNIRLAGRTMSGLADLLTVLAVFLTGRRLFGWRAGLLASAFSAFSVLQIQHAHFSVVEAMLTMCTAWCMFFVARVVSTRISKSRHVFGFWGNAALAGIFAGLAVACKISVWPTAVMLVLAIVVAMLRDRRGFAAAAFDAVLAAIIAGVFTFGAFRVVQPYAFVGNSALEWQYTSRDCAGLTGPDAETCTRILPMPDSVSALVLALPEGLRPILAPSSRWVAELQNAAASASGESDPPFGWQWANRSAVTFPLTNIIFWGLGIPLGLAALAGVIFAIAQVWRGRRAYAYVIPALWTVGFFLYQGTQFVKSIRYQLPIYPMLCVLAAAGLLAFWRRFGNGTALRRAAALAPAALVLAGTATWALAFMNIYTDVMPRVQATRWLYQNAPTAVTLSGRAANADRQFQLPIIDLAVFPDAPASFSFKLQKEADGLSAPLNTLTLQLNQVSGGGDSTVRIIESGTEKVIAEKTQRLGFDNATLSFDSAAALEPDRDYRIEFTSSDLLAAATSVVTDQHWDEGVPTRVDGRDPYSQYYRGLTAYRGGNIEIYNEEDPGKTEQLMNALDEADYVILSTNRHYGSVARLPWRFPMTNRYFESLMSGELGFELAADFNRFIQIGPFVFNDQEFPHRLARTPNTQGSPPAIEVPYPPAEEAFSVYDHPRVLIFKKTPAYTRANAESILGVFDLTRTIKRTAFQYNKTPGGLMLDAKTLDAQRVSGTWSEIFPRSSPLNQSQPLAVLAWLALFEALGIAGFLLLASLSRRAIDGNSTLVDGGFAFGKVLGLLAIATSGWLIASLKLATFERPLLITLAAVLAVTAAIVGHRNREHIIALVKSRWRVMLAAELLFLLSFCFWLYVRAGNPDMWHPYFGGEKPMDTAFLTSVLKAAYFPPQDPWFTGGYINYYYFGFVVIGWPIKLLGINPAVAYNLAVPTLFALTALGAYGVAASIYDAIARWRAADGAAAGNLNRVVLAGLLAALFAVYIGNAKQINTVGPALQTLGGANTGTPGVIALVSGFGKWLGGAELPIPLHHNYWNASRPEPEIPIGEFPNFTFLYADLHAHMIAMPLAFLALAFALAFASGARRLPTLMAGAMAAGALWPANTWDYFPYLLLGIGALIVGRFDEEQTEGDSQITRWLNALTAALPSMLIFGLLSRVIYLPYHQTFGAGYSQIDPWLGERTTLGTYAAIHGLFLLPLVIGMLHHLRLFGAAQAKDDRKLALGALGVGLIAALVLVARSAQSATGNPEQNTVALTSLMSAPLMLLALVAALRDKTPGPMRMLWLMTTGALALTLFVEHYTLRGDIGRQNTVFKFYIVVWLLLSSASAAAFVWLLDVFAEKPKPLPAPAAEMPSLTPAFSATALPLGASSQLVADAATAQSSDSTVFNQENNFSASTDTPDATSAPQVPEQPELPESGAPQAPQTLAAHPALSAILTTLVALGTAFGLLYPVFAIPAKRDDRYVPEAKPGLDGTAYMQTALLQGWDLENGRQPFALKGDYEAIRWMQDNVAGSPTIMEGHAQGNQYRWAGRFSINTGLPNVVGWQFHQRQQRGGELLDERVIYDRFTDVENFYGSPNTEDALKIIKRYNVKYIVVSVYEKMYFNPGGFSKFPELAARGALKNVYANETVTIYEVLNAR